MQPDHPPSNTNQGQSLSLVKIKIARKRCPKATNSKAVGGTQPTALPSSPIRADLLDSIVRAVETGQ